MSVPDTAIRIAVGARFLRTGAALAAVLAAGLPACRNAPAATGTGSAPAPNAKLRLWVPAYYYPNGPGLQQWEKLMAAARRTQIVAIVNPNSGPGDHRDANYASLIPRARAAGLTLVGYIGTQYGRKTIEQVEGEVDLFLRFYPEIQGIHFDEQASDPEHVDYYANLAEYVRRKIPKALVVTNPGTHCAREYVARNASDVVCLFERNADLAAYTPPAWVNAYPPSRFAVVAYQVGSEAEMRACLRDAVSKHAGNVFVTDARGSNPYDRLPTYWDAEVAAVQEANKTPRSTPYVRAPRSGRGPSPSPVHFVHVVLLVHAAAG